MKLNKLLLPVILSTALAACGNLSKVSKEGTTDQPVWPKVEKSTFNSHGTERGMWPNWDNVHQIKKGMNKDQIVALIGRPHFNEGLFGVREWDYVFNYLQNGQRKICQFKVLFDENLDAQSLYWLPEGCGNNQSGQTISLSSDFLFDFDSSELKPESRGMVAELAKKLPKDKKISVTGYTDRLGSESYNLALSKKRAEVVKAELVKNGISAKNIKTEGLGKSVQIVSCDSVSGDKLKSCLAENRRVIISTN